MPGWTMTSGAYRRPPQTIPVLPGASGFLQYEDLGFAFDPRTYNSVTAAAYVGGPVGGTVSVKDTNPSNVLSNVCLDNSPVTNSGTAPKFVQWNEPPIYLKWVPHNLQEQSQTFDNAEWTKTTCSVTANDAVAPDGTTTMDKVTWSGAAGTVRGGANAATSLFYNLSVYVKRSAGTNWFELILTDNSANEGRAWFDIANGTTGTTGGIGTFTVLNPQMVPLGSSIYRVSAAILVGNANLRMEFQASSGDGVHDSSANGDAVWLWGAQLSRGHHALPYLVTTTTVRYGIPQAWDVTTSQYALVDEPTTTNLCLWSSDLTQATWTKSNMTTAMTATGPDYATNSATTLTATAGNATALQSITSASSGRNTSVWLRRRTGTGNVDLTQDNGTTWATKAITTDWARYYVTLDSLTNPTVGIRIVTSGDAVDVFGFQHQTGAVATSTWPTLGATSARVRDEISISNSLFPYNSSFGTMYASVMQPTTGSAHLMGMNDGTANEQVIIQNLTGNIKCQVTDGGVNQTPGGGGVNSGFSATDGVAYKAAAAWALNDISISANGGAAVSDPDTATLPTMTTLSIANDSGGTTNMNGPLYYAVFLPRNSSDPELQVFST